MIFSETSIEFFKKGQKEHILENYDAAVYYYKKSIEENPHYLDPLFNLARVYYSIENYDYAFKYINRALKLSPKNSDIVLLQSNIEIQLRMYNIAEKRLKEILNDDPLNIEAYNSLAYLYLKNNNKILAKKNLDTVLKTSPSNFEALHLTAVYYEKINKNIAEEFYIKNIEHNSLNPDSYYYYSIFNFKNNNISKAVKHIETALSIKESVKYKKYHGKYLLFLNQPDKALKIFKEVLKEEKDNYLSFYYLAQTYYLLSNYKKAIDSLLKVLKLREDDEIASYFLNKILIKHMEIENPIRQSRADHYYKLALKAKNETKYSLFLYLLKEAIRLNPRFADARIELADYFLLQKQPERSFRELVVAAKYKESRALDDRIEIEKKRILYRLGNDWNVNQYRIKNNFYPVPIFTVKNIENIHFNCDDVYFSILKNYFVEKMKYELVINKEKEYTALDKITICKKNKSPFYIDLHIVETGNTIEITVNLYNAINTELIKNYTIVFTGNDKIIKSAITLHNKVNQDIPFKAHIIKISKNKALINAGRRSDIALKDEFLILKKKNYPIEFDNSEIIFSNDDIKGYGIAVKIDENITEILLKDNDYYNEIDIDDIVIEKK